MRDRCASKLPAQIIRIIEFTGLEIPLLALGNEPSAVILGNRRAAAVKEMGNFDEVPVYVARTPWELSAWLDADKALVDRNRPSGMPWTWRQRAEVLDAALAGLGQSRGGSGGPSRGIIPALADYFEVGEVQLRNAVYLLRFERQGGTEGERAQQALNLVEKGELKPQSAYRKLRDGDPMVVGVGPTTPRASVAQQEKVLRAAVDALAGITYGLEQIGDIDPAMKADVRAELVGPLSKARTAIRRLTLQLQNNQSKGEENG